MSTSAAITDRAAASNRQLPLDRGSSRRSRCGPRQCGCRRRRARSGNTCAHAPAGLRVPAAHERPRNSRGSRIPPRFPRPNGVRQKHPTSRARRPCGGRGTFPRGRLDWRRCRRTSALPNGGRRPIPAEVRPASGRSCRRVPHRRKSDAGLGNSFPTGPKPWCGRQRTEVPIRCRSADAGRKTASGSRGWEIPSGAKQGSSAPVGLPVTSARECSAPW